MDTKDIMDFKNFKYFNALNSYKMCSFFRLCLTFLDFVLFCDTLFDFV